MCVCVCLWGSEHVSLWMRRHSYNHVCVCVFTRAFVSWWRTLGCVNVFYVNMISRYINWEYMLCALYTIYKVKRKLLTVKVHFFECNSVFPNRFPKDFFIIHWSSKLTPLVLFLNFQSTNKVSLCVLIQDIFLNTMLYFGTQVCNFCESSINISHIYLCALNKQHNVYR